MALLSMINGFFLGWAQWPMSKNGLGLLIGFPSVDLEKNRRIEYLFARLRPIS